MTKLNEDRLLQVLLAPVISEKSTMVADKNEQGALLAKTGHAPVDQARVDALGIGGAGRRIGRRIRRCFSVGRAGHFDPGNRVRGILAAIG